MAIKSQSEIVHFIREGTFESLPYSSLYTRPGEIWVRVLSPVSTVGLNYRQRDELINRLRYLARSNALAS